jgi:hypothetical protein
MAETLTAPFLSTSALDAPTKRSSLAFRPIAAPLIRAGPSELVGEEDHVPRHRALSSSGRPLMAHSSLLRSGITSSLTHMRGASCPTSEATSPLAPAELHFCTIISISCRLVSEHRAGLNPP